MKLPRIKRSRALNTHLKRNLSETTGAFDVETEDGQSHVQFILNGFLACIEFLPLIDVLATRFAPDRNPKEDDTKATGIIPVINERLQRHSLSFAVLS